MENKKDVVYPYIPEGRTIEYVSQDNEFMQEAKKNALEHSLDENQPTGSVIVKDGKVVGRGANGSNYHKEKACERVRLGCKTGENYELCEGCHPKNHSEAKAVLDAKSRGEDMLGAEIYLWGHWWCCKPCWDAIIGAGIAKVFLEEGSEVHYDRKNPNNILKKSTDK